MKYDTYCDFDIEKHKQTYIDYLEVLILENGKAEYIAPQPQIETNTKQSKPKDPFDDCDI